jgi:asparaginyl-tRNA synthetase
MDSITHLQHLQLGPVRVRGWIEKVHTLKRHSFITLRDGVGKESRVQVFTPKRVATDLVVESYIEIEGVVRALPETARSFRPFEIEAQKLTILGKSDSEVVGRCPPDAGVDIKLTERHLYLRDPTFALVTKLRAVLLRSLREHFDSQDMVEITPPSFTGVECEGGATLFHLKHPGTAGHDDVDCYLSQSGQFWLEFAAPGVGDCYCIAPSFRAEKSHTRRHLTEFTHAEAEWVGIMSLEDHLDKLRSLLRGTVDRFFQYGHPYLEELGLIEHVQQIRAMCDDIVVMTHREAIQYCHDHGIFKDEETQTPFDWMDDIPEMQERRIIDQIGKIVFLVKFPAVHKSFYMERDPDEPEYVWGCDVEAVGVGEIIGSGVRVWDEQELRARLRAQGLKEEDYSEYIDLRRFGPGRTSGMGLGVDRMLTWLLAKHSIREVVTYPRYPGRLRP